MPLISSRRREPFSPRRVHTPAGFFLPVVPACRGAIYGDKTEPLLRATARSYSAVATGASAFSQRSKGNL